MQESFSGDANDPNLIGGRYRLYNKLGQGSFGQVFRAEDLRFEPARTVAIKLLLPELLSEPNIRESVKREAGTLAKFSHPNILRVIDYNVTDTQAYIVTEFAEGGSLIDKIRSAPSKILPLNEIVTLLEQLADAIDEAHSEGLIHRDIKPQNILIDKRGRPLIADFGLVAVLSSSQTAMSSGTIGGTPLYMPNEQWLGKASKASDIYALAVVIFQLLTGRPPYLGNKEEIWGQHRAAPIPSLSTFASHMDYPEALDQVIARGMAKETVDRIRPAKEFYRQFKEALSGSKYSSMAGGFDSLNSGFVPSSYNSDNFDDLKVHVSNPENDYSKYNPQPVENHPEIPRSSTVSIRRRKDSSSVVYNYTPAESIVPVVPEVAQSLSYREIQPEQQQAIVVSNTPRGPMTSNEGVAWRMVFNKLGYVVPNNLISKNYNAALSSAGCATINFEYETVILHIGMPKPLNFGAISAVLVNCRNKQDQPLWEANGDEVIITNSRIIVISVNKKKEIQAQSFDLTKVYRFEPMEVQKSTAAILYGSEQNLTMNMVFGNQIVSTVHTLGTLWLNSTTNQKAKNANAVLQLYKAVGNQQDVENVTNAFASNAGSLKNAFFQFCVALSGAK